MNDKIDGHGLNGHALADAPVTQDAQPNQQPSAPTLDQILDARLGPVFQAMINGALVSNPGVPGDALIVKICEVIGTTVGGCVNGASGAPITQVFTTRGEMKRAFERGMGRAQVVAKSIMDHGRPGAGRG